MVSTTGCITASRACQGFLGSVSQPPGLPDCRQRRDRPDSTDIKTAFFAGSCGISLVRSGSVRHRVSRCCGVQNCIHGAVPQDLAV
jgi:hypothetical protein